MDTSKKERLARLSELNKLALGVSSFEALEAGSETVVGRRAEVNRDLLLAIREKKGYICRAVARRNRNWCGSGVDFICSCVENEPMCCATSDSNIHVIKLNTEGNLWCQWVYQFAHEYCHHIIDGGLTGETSGLIWLEESICHVASFVCLDFFERICVSSDTPYLLGYSQGVFSYLRDLLFD